MSDIAPEKVIINGVEYDPSDAQQLVELGAKTRDFEKQYNTDISKVMPDYTRATQEAASEKREREALAAKVKSYEEKAKQAETPEEQTKALNALRAIGGLDRDTAKKEFVSRDELDTYFATKNKEQEDSKTIIDTGKRLQTEITGEDGRAPYNAKAVLAYANSYGFFDGRRSYEQSLKDAYDEMAGSQNDKWKQDKIESAKKPGLQTLKSGGIKTPEERKIDNLDDAKASLNEILWGNSE